MTETTQNPALRQRRRLVVYAVTPWPRSVSAQHPRQLDSPPCPPRGVFFDSDLTLVPISCAQ